MSNIFDTQVLKTAIIGVVRDTFRKTLRAEMQGEPVAAEKDIIEYESRMRVFPLEKFNGPVYVAYVNFYASPKEMQSLNVAGTFLLFVKEDIAEKLLKALGHSSKDAENEEALMDKIGEFCHTLAGSVKDEFVNQGYPDLVVSPPQRFKSSVPDGVPFDYDLYTKQEISFKFWNQNCIVIEACMGAIPRKGA